MKHQDWTIALETSKRLDKAAKLAERALEEALAALRSLPEEAGLFANEINDLDSDFKRGIDSIISRLLQNVAEREDVRQMIRRDAKEEQRLERLREKAA